MARSYSNTRSRIASWFTVRAHRQASMLRWIVILVLAIVWIGAGYLAWSQAPVEVDNEDPSPLEIVYRVVTAPAMPDVYFKVQNNDTMKDLTRFAGLALPLVGLFFAFSGSLGRNVAHAFSRGASNHVVIAGNRPAAISLALDCRRNNDSVFLIASDLPDETARDLRRRGVMVVHGAGAHADTLGAARAAHAAHVVAFEDEDTENLQIEAAVRRLVATVRRRKPLSVHVATQSSMLLREAREMRALIARQKKDAGIAEPIDPKPFSLEEIAARYLVQREAQTVLDVAELIGREKLNFVFFGFDETAEVLAQRLLMSFWSVKFGAPQITVLTPNPGAAEALFKARYAEAFAYPQHWSANIAFLPFDWNERGVSAALLDEVESARGKPCAAIVATGGDPGNIHLSIALRRLCNNRGRWPIPIFMRESGVSEFSQQFARGDTTEELDAYLQAFGAHQHTATRARILEGVLDRGAAIAHQRYSENLGDHDEMSLHALQAANRTWGNVLETYRAANRAVADSAMVKLWDAGWRPAQQNERGHMNPSVPEQLLRPMAEIEHCRWMAERLMSGWRPADEGEARDNELMIHDKITPWDALTETERAKDEVQVRAAIDIARGLYKHGFVLRAPLSDAITQTEAAPSPGEGEQG